MIPGIAAGLLLFALAGAAHAELGGDASTIEADRVQMRATLRQMQSQSYTVHEITMPSGTLVREYLSPSGTVFAVAWNGPMMPDLKQLFGAHFSHYQSIAQSRHGQRGPIAFDDAGLVVQSGGRMRAFSGRAYLPSLVPSNVSVDAIQ